MVLYLIDTFTNTNSKLPFTDSEADAGGLLFPVAQLASVGLRREAVCSKDELS